MNPKTPNNAVAIPHPRRILAVSLADSAKHLSDVIKDLTGTYPSPASPDAASIAGTTHLLELATPYYTASVPVWLDLVASPGEWSASFLSAEAREVLDVLGGVLVVFPLPSPRFPSAAAAAQQTHVAQQRVPVLPSSSSSSSSSAALPVTSESQLQSRLGFGSQAESQGQARSQPQPQSQSQSQSQSDRERWREETRELITHIGKVVREGLGGWEWDGVGLALGVSSSSSSRGSGAAVGPGDGDPTTVGNVGCDEGLLLDEWEDFCAENGLEFVHVARPGPGAGSGSAESQQRNEFGERMGMARVLEALQANDWSGAGLSGAEDDQEEEGGEKGKAKREDVDGSEEDDEFDPESLDFGYDPKDFVGLKKAIWAGGGDGGGDGAGDDDVEIGDEDVQKLERMMLKLQAVRDATAGLPEDQRRRMAARAVGEVMKEL